VAAVGHHRTALAEAWDRGNAAFAARTGNDRSEAANSSYSPPYMPQIALWSSWGLPEEHLLLLKASRTSDALWTAEQMLRNGSCGAVLFWQNEVRDEAIRRLHLAAQTSQILC
jgi:hypothetical protein